MKIESIDLIKINGVLDQAFLKTDLPHPSLPDLTAELSLLLNSNIAEEYLRANFPDVPINVIVRYKNDKT